MTALFADTFYWIALADSTDSSHQRALSLTEELAGSRIVTTDEVLTEYLTFFAAAPEPFRSSDPAEPKFFPYRSSALPSETRQRV